MALRKSTRRNIITESRRRHHSGYAAAYYPEIGLIDLVDFDYTSLLSREAIDSANHDNLRNHATLVHEITHFHQNIGTIYGIDTLLLGISNSSAISMILEIYKTHWRPQNISGKFLPIADFARAEFRAIYDQRVMAPDGQVLLAAPPGMHNTLTYFVLVDGLLNDFEGMAPVPLSEVSPTWKWDRMYRGAYLSFSTDSPKTLARTHLLFTPACYDHSTERTAVSIGARALQESWAAVVEAISLGNHESFPRSWRDLAAQQRHILPDIHDYYSAFDYVEDRLKCESHDQLLAVFLACADISLMYSGILEHGLVSPDRLPSVLSHDDIKRWLESDISLTLTTNTEHVPTTAEVFISAVKAAQMVEPLSKNHVADLRRFMEDVVEAMGLPRIYDRIHMYLNHVLYPFMKKRRAKLEINTNEHEAAAYEHDSTDYRLSLCEQALRMRLIYPDFFINVWNKEYRRRLAEQFRPLNLVDSSGDKSFVIHRNNYIVSWFMNQLMSSKEITCPRQLFGLDKKDGLQCVLRAEREPRSLEGRSGVRWPVCDEGTYTECDFESTLRTATCDIKGMYDYYRLKDWIE